MSIVIGVVSARDWEGNMLSWSNLDNVLNDLCVNNNLAAYCFYVDNVFLGGWTCIRTPHRGAWQNSLNNRLIMDDMAMKKIRI